MFFPVFLYIITIITTVVDCWHGLLLFFTLFFFLFFFDSSLVHSSLLDLGDWIFFFKFKPLSLCFSFSLSFSLFLAYVGLSSSFQLFCRCFIFFQFYFGDYVGMKKER
ncbi:hypothetical protein, unlikely [Trypanosoma brucei gambiense DAL972]|uniref:Uncharacterized protein n=1 Tax=Trypanosoma brucei gambiense (strain MHOM/CI/86/DAL972) TaxID=679716 RepID=C9ZQL8_TRYB9|nr:hypothetical protein, unlikely [Trypanosoma brucei gambiense DAL972]CBH11698.1 hypothetical protein, unlikely [Trypanosoma brucei gambiense DAL972]|eukprot:XP_011773983.1 hypothetical protein, unlikely [Trypanosoma brucei gambiense DAL972]